MQTVEPHDDIVRHHHLAHDPFDGARRVVLEQAETFSVPASFVVPPFAHLDPEVSSGAVEHALTASDYYDTAQLSLARAGITLRRGCDDDAWVVTMAGMSSAGESIRREIWYPGSGNAAPAELRRLLKPQLDAQPLAVVAQLSTRSSVTPLFNRSGVRIADVVDEHTVATRDTGASAQFRLIDVQVRDLNGVGHRVLAEVHRLLTAAGCTREPRIAAYARAFGGDGFSA